MTVPTKPLRKLGTQAPRVTDKFIWRAPTGGIADFTNDPIYFHFTLRLVGDGDAARLLKDMRSAGVPNFHKVSAFKRWVTDVWLQRTVNPVKRGRSYWQRIARIVWEIFDTTHDLRRCARFALKKEMERIANADRRTHKKMVAARKRRKLRRRERGTRA